MRIRYLRRILDLESLNKILAVAIIFNSGSIWKNIHKLEPATYLVWQNGEAVKIILETQFNISEISLVSSKRIDSHINDSVRSRLVSDVPLGIFLSGGIDSIQLLIMLKKF